MKKRRDARGLHEDEPREDALVSKELDGDLSRSEAMELERAEWTNPDIRRTRRGWQRTASAMSNLGPARPKIPVEQWAGRIMAQARPRASRWTLVLRWLDSVVDGGWSHPLAMSVCGLAAVAAVAVVAWLSALDSRGTVGVPTAQLTPEVLAEDVPMPPPAPVEIRVAGPDVEERDDVLVSIRF